MLAVLAGLAVLAVLAMPAMLAMLVMLAILGILVFPDGVDAGDVDEDDDSHAVRARSLECCRLSTSRPLLVAAFPLVPTAGIYGGDGVVDGHGHCCH